MDFPLLTPRTAWRGMCIMRWNACTLPATVTVRLGAIQIESQGAVVRMLLCNATTCVKMLITITKQCEGCLFI